MKKLLCVTLLGFVFSLAPAISNAAEVQPPQAETKQETKKSVKKTERHEKKKKDKKEKKHASKKRARAKAEKSV